jgi:hypothetical protein
MTVDQNQRQLRHPRLRREFRTLTAMVSLYCRNRHGVRPGLCASCRQLLDYAAVRLERCCFQERKPTCVQCPVHCYRPRERELVREIMRYAGPRMLWRHPVLALLHLFDGRRPVPAVSPSRAPNAAPRTTVGQPSPTIKVEHSGSEAGC